MVHWKNSIWLNSDKAACNKSNDWISWWHGIMRSWWILFIMITWYTNSESFIKCCKMVTTPLIYKWWYQPFCCDNVNWECYLNLFHNWYPCITSSKQGNRTVSHIYWHKSCLPQLHGITITIGRETNGIHKYAKPAKLCLWLWCSLLNQYEWVHPRNWLSKYIKIGKQSVIVGAIAPSIKFKAFIQQNYY